MVRERGKFFVIEGSDGTTKGTQANLLVERLRSEGREVLCKDFPQYGENAFADTVGEYLTGKFGDPTRVNPYLASMPFALDRFMASHEIRQALGNGKIVVTNRYTSANIGHQGSKIESDEERRQFLDWVEEVEFSERGLHIPRPDLVVCLYLDARVAQRLIDKKAERKYMKGKKRDGHESNLPYLLRTASAFVDVAMSDPSWRILKCGDGKGWILPPEVIHEKVWEIVSPLLPQKA